MSLSSLPPLSPHEPPRPMPPPRRWLRFSLRTLLIAITLFGIWLGLRVNAGRREQLRRSENSEAARSITTFS
jgi:hypothetical protein